MKRFCFALAFAGLVGSAFGFDDRYVLTEYSMNNCPACVNALADVAEITQAGIDVRCVNTSLDSNAAEEARRYQLKLRPAWRLAAKDGREVGRWYGAGRAAVIVATIRAKFPSPDAVEDAAPSPVDESLESAASAESLESESVGGSGSASVASVKPSLVEDVAAMIKANDAALSPDHVAPEAVQLEASAPETSAVEPAATVDRELYDFRNRRTVAQTFEDGGFLDRSQREWEERGRDGRDDFGGGDESDGSFEDYDAEDDLESSGRFRLFRGNGDGNGNGADGGSNDEATQAKLGDRIADRASANILKGLEPFLNRIEKDALGKLDAIGEDATKSLEGFVGSKFDGAIDDIKNAILRQIHAEIVGVLRKVLLFVVGLALVVAVVWLLRKYERARFEV